MTNKTLSSKGFRPNESFGSVGPEHDKMEHLALGGSDLMRV